MDGYSLRSFLQFMLSFFSVSGSGVLRGKRAEEKGIYMFAFVEKESQISGIFTIFLFGLRTASCELQSDKKLTSLATAQMPFLPLRSLAPCFCPFDAYFSTLSPPLQSLVLSHRILIQTRSDPTARYFLCLLCISSAHQ